MLNKKGSIELILFFLVLFTILLIGFIATFVIGITDYVSDEVTPIMEGLGMADKTNLSQAATFTFTKLNVIVQALPWIVGFGYIAALIFTVVFVMSIRINPHPVFIGFYFMMMILLIFGSILISNMYQDFHQSNDDIGTRLQENTIMSYALLYSPAIMILITILSGIILFTRTGESAEGGFGI